MTSLISRQASPEEQGSVQGAASSLESLGRAIGPVWGNGVLQLAGAGAAFGSGALVLASLALVMVGRAASDQGASRAAA
jgi:predicted MFS family arabinose efflux permease